MALAALQVKKKNCNTSKNAQLATAAGSVHSNVQFFQLLVPTEVGSCWITANEALKAHWDTLSELRACLVLAAVQMMGSEGGETNSSAIQPNSEPGVKILYTYPLAKKSVSIGRYLYTTIFMIKNHGLVISVYVGVTAGLDGHLRQTIEQRAARKLRAPWIISSHTYSSFTCWTNQIH